MTAAIYWIHSKDHSNYLLEGYIGVSKNAQNRWKYGHQWAQKNNRHCNLKFSNAIAKHGWENLIKEILVIGPEDYCYELEKKLRPKECLGWNLTIGGSKPPLSKPRGKDYVSPLKGQKRKTPWLIGRAPANKGLTISEETKNKISIGNSGHKNTPEHLAKRMASRRLTRIAKGQIKAIIVNGIQYESSKNASDATHVPESTLNFWANKKSKPSKKYNFIFECRWL